MGTLDSGSLARCTALLRRWVSIPKVQSHVLQFRDAHSDWRSLVAYMLSHLSGALFGRIHVQYISYLFSVFFLICIPYAFAKTTSLTIEQGVDSRSVRKASRATRTRRALLRRSLRAPLRSVFTHYFPSRLLVSRMQWTNE